MGSRAGCAEDRKKLQPPEGNWRASSSRSITGSTANALFTREVVSRIGDRVKHVTLLNADLKVRGLAGDLARTAYTEKNGDGPTTRPAIFSPTDWCEARAS